MMHYFDYILKYQQPARPLPTTGNKESDEKLSYISNLYKNDIPLSGTDPLGEFYVSSVALSPLFSGIGKGVQAVKQLVQKPINEVTQNVIKFAGQSIGPKLTNAELVKLPVILQKQAKILQEAGVDITKLTRTDLENALTKRWGLLDDLGKETRVARSRPTATGYYAEIVDGGDKVGSIKLTHTKTDPEVSMIVSYKPGNGIGKDLYDTGIRSAQQDGYTGIISGRNLVSPQQTTSTWRHYPNKQLIAKDGLQTFDATTIKETPVYLLTEPAGNTPAKSILFNPTIIDKNGIMHIDLKSKDLLKTGLPLWIGTQNIQQATTNQ